MTRTSAGAHVHLHRDHGRGLGRSDCWSSSERCEPRSAGVRRLCRTKSGRLSVQEREHRSRDTALKRGVRTVRVMTIQVFRGDVGQITN